MTERLDTLAGLWNALWRRLEEGVERTDAPARHAVLATARRDGGASARILVLRAADRENRRLAFWTNAASEKIAELAANPNAEVLIWDATARLQFRLAVGIRVSPGPAETWARLPDVAKANYAPGPGDPVNGPEAEREAPDLTLFAQLDARILGADVLHLGRDRHRRARFAASDGFAGAWIAP